MGARSSSAVCATLEGVKGPPGGRHGFFPSPYGTGMVPTSTGLSSAATSTDTASAEISPPPPPSGKFRVMLPLGEAPPEGYVAVGKRTLPAGDMLLDYVAAQQQGRCATALLNLVEMNDLFSIPNYRLRLKTIAPSSIGQLFVRRMSEVRLRWFNFPALG